MTYLIMHLVKMLIYLMYFYGLTVYIYNYIYMIISTKKHVTLWLFNIAMV